MGALAYRQEAPSKRKRKVKSKTKVAKVLPFMPKGSLALAERSELIDYYAKAVDMSDGWIRKMVLEKDRIDILAAVVLKYELKPFHLSLLKFQFQHPENLQLCYRGAGKCHGIDTPILMYDGTVKAVQDVMVGDQLMGPDSKPRTVMNLSTGRGPLYRVNPVKGDSWVCNENHKITVYGRGHYDGQRRELTPVEVMDWDKELKRGFRDQPWKLWRAPVRFPKKSLPFNPYLMGLWFGDGDCAGTRITNPEPEIERFLTKWADKYGYSVTEGHNTGGCPYFDLVTPGGKGEPNPFRRYVRSLEDKRIPREYLTGSRKQRLRFLAGLLDTDGYYDQERNCYEIAQVREHISQDIAFLCRSLGFGAYVAKKDTSIKKTGYKGVAYRVTISGDLDEIPCKVSRKKARSRLAPKDVQVVGLTVEAIGEGDFYGFEVDGDHLYLLGDCTVTHNSTMCTVVKCIHLLLKDHNLRILIASKTIQNAETYLREIKAHFEANEDLRRIFGIQYDSENRTQKWGAREIETYPRTRDATMRGLAKEASITCIGVEGMVVGKHYDVIISDDLCDEANCATELMREKLKTWYYKVLDPTLEPPDLEVPHRGEHHKQGTRYHYDDLWGHLIANELLEHFQNIPALNDNGDSPWPEKHPPEYFHEKRKRSGLLIFNAQYLNDTEAMKGSIFKYDDCIQMPEDEYPDISKMRVYMGVDLAIGEKEQNDKFAMVVIGCVGSLRDPTIYVLDYFAGQLRFGLQTKKIVEWAKIYKPLRCGMEVNAYQKSQYQAVRRRHSAMPIKKIFTDTDKVIRASNLSPRFENHRMHFKKTIHHGIIDELVLFPGDKRKDLFDALFFAVDACSRNKKRSRTKEPEVLGGKSTKQEKSYLRRQMAVGVPRTRKAA